MTITKSLILIYCSLLISCTNKVEVYPNETSVVEKLLAHLSKNDSVSIKNLIGVLPEEIGTSSEIINYNINKAYEIIKTNGIPDKKSFIFKTYPSNDYRLLDVIVPLKVGQTKGLRKAEINISFVKYLPVGKILDFDFTTDYEVNMIDSANVVK